MKEVDYIVVGLGIAGICFAERLLQQNKTFVVFKGASGSATEASGGVLNPTVLKRFTIAWNAPQFFKEAIPFYKTLSSRLHMPILEETAIHRIFNSVEEQNNWMVASDKKELATYLISEIQKNNELHLYTPFGTGAVKGGAIINPKQLITAFENYLDAKGLMRFEDFKHQEVLSNDTEMQYKDLVAKNIVCAEGAHIHNNPFFNLTISPDGDREFVGNKGQYTVIKAPDLRLNTVVKGAMMLIPLGDDLYKIGATYNRDDFSDTPSEEDTEEILSKLRKMISCDFEIVDQVVGVRPTVKDRKPLLGSFYENKNIFFMNGLGTRGLSMAPLLSKWLFEHIENKMPLPKEVDLKRFL